LGVAARIAEFLRTLFLHNVLLKLVSIAIAFGLWFFVNAAERDSEAEYPIPVRLENAPASLMLVSPRVDEVELRVSGPRTLLNRIEGANLSVDIDLSRVRPGMTTFRVRPGQLPLPRGVTPIRMTPSEITLEFAKIATKRVPVELAVGGRPAGDLLITESKVTPEQVEIRGPELIVGDIEVVKTEPIDLSEAQPGRIKRSVELELPVEYVSASSPAVHVELRLEEPVGQGITGPIAIVVRNAVGDASVVPPQASLRVRGPRSKVEALELPNGAVYVDAQGLEPGTHRLTPLASLPAGIELAQELKQVTVKIVEIPPTATPSVAPATPTPRTPQSGAAVSEEILLAPESSDVG
jgi:YbbR domain-containing protein